MIPHQPVRKDLLINLPVLRCWWRKPQVEKFALPTKLNLADSVVQSERTLRDVLKQTPNWLKTWHTCVGLVFTYMFWSPFESKEQARTLSSSTCHLRPGAAFGQGKATWAKFAKGALAKWTCPCDRISCRLSTWKSLNHSNSQRNLKALTGQRSNSSKLFFSTPHRFIGFPKRCGEINVDCWSYLASKGDRCEAGYCRTFSWMKKSNLGKLINSCWKDQQQNYVSHNIEQ